MEFLEPDAATAPDSTRPSSTFRMPDGHMYMWVSKKGPGYRVDKETAYRIAVYSNIFGFVFYPVIAVIILVFSHTAPAVVVKILHQHIAIIFDEMAIYMVGLIVLGLSFVGLWALLYFFVKRMVTAHILREAETIDAPRPPRAATWRSFLRTTYREQFEEESDGWLFRYQLGLVFMILLMLLFAVDGMTEPPYGNTALLFLLAIFFAWHLVFVRRLAKKTNQERKAKEETAASLGARPEDDVTASSDFYVAPSAGPGYRLFILGFKSVVSFFRALGSGFGYAERSRWVLPVAFLCMPGLLALFAVLLRNDIVTVEPDTVGRYQPSKALADIRDGAFQRSATNRDTGDYAVKWSGPLFIAVTGDTSRMESDIDGYIRELRRLTGLEMTRVAHRDNANMMLHFAAGFERDENGKHRPYYWRIGWKFPGRIRSATFTISMASAKAVAPAEDLVRLTGPSAHRTHRYSWEDEKRLRVVWALIRMLGVMGKQPSIYKNYRIGDWDSGENLRNRVVRPYEYVLGVLYDSRIKQGMTFTEAEPILRRITQEIETTGSFDKWLSQSRK